MSLNYTARSVIISMLIGGYYEGFFGAIISGLWGFSLYIFLSYFIDSFYKKKEKKYSVKEIYTDNIDDLIGLNSVKENINTIVNSIKIEKLRGGETIPGHYIFQGNPGTGKTTVARILGKKFKELGLLKKGHFIDITREDLVGEWQGTSAKKTKEILTKALGGVLFIDEAYSLKTANGDDFGQEVINTIVPFIEDNRDRIIVIIAGYTKPMGKFLDSNPGLKSRFNHTIDFEDYNSDEMYKIFKLIAKGFNWNIKVEIKLKDYFKYLQLNKDTHFGNARDVRKVFENIKRVQINRLIKVDNLKSKDDRLYVFIEEDINS